MKKIWELFYTFFKIGAFTFGGGYAMIGLIEADCVDKKHWITHDDMMNLTVIAESTPGPIAINCATFVGYKYGGMLGSIAATVGVVLPSLIIISLIAKVLDNFLEIKWIANALLGIRVGVGIIIVRVAVNMIKKMKKNPLPLGILICACVAMLLIDIFSLKFSSIYLILIAGVFSFIVYMATKQKGGAAK